jgi:hypothetical protein
MPAHAEEHAEAVREGVKMNWLRTINQFDEGQMQVEIMELDENGKAVAAPAGSRAGGRHRHLGARPGGRLGLPAVDPRHELRRRRRQRRPHHADDRCARHLRRRRRGPSERTVTVGVGHGKKAAKMIDLWLSNIEEWVPKESTTWRASTSSTSGTGATTDAPPSPNWPIAAAQGLRRGRRRPDRGRGPDRGMALPELRQLHRVRRLPGILPRGRRHQARQGQPVPLRLRQVHRLRHLLRAVPGARHRDDRGTLSGE